MACEFGRDKNLCNKARKEVSKGYHTTSKDAIDNDWRLQRRVKVRNTT